MNWFRAQLTRTPLAARVAPFVVFVVLTFCQDLFGPAGRYWIYLAKTVLGAAMLVVVWPAVQEMRWKLSAEAVLVGFVVFALWVGLDDLFVQLGFKPYPKWNLSGGQWNPQAQFGEDLLCMAEEDIDVDHPEAAVFADLEGICRTMQLATGAGPCTPAVAAAAP